ncbi:hypothetical protein OSTOST_23432, partial [Ostertagia ostertagi]
MLTQINVSAVEKRSPRLQNSIEKLIRQNEELLRKNSSLQKQGRMIVEEKMEIIRRQVQKLKKEHSNYDAYLAYGSRSVNTTASSNTFFQWWVQSLCQTGSMADFRSMTSPDLRWLNYVKVLQEKNVLKGRVMELEEELENLRPGRKERERDDLL